MSILFEVNAKMKKTNCNYKLFDTHYLDTKKVNQLHKDREFSSFVL